MTTESIKLKHAKTIIAPYISKAKSHKACYECKTSCQSACKTSCTVGNQVCASE